MHFEQCLNNSASAKSYWNPREQLSATSHFREVSIPLISLHKHDQNYFVSNQHRNVDG